jgi:hypothetical protein
VNMTQEFEDPKLELEQLVDRSQRCPASTRQIQIALLIPVVIWYQEGK